MASGSRGWNWSKQSVKCDYCSKEGRRDNIESHIQKDHAGKKIKVSVIKPKDAGDISLFLQKTEALAVKEPSEQAGKVAFNPAAEVVDHPDHVPQGSEVVDDTDLIDINQNRKRTKSKHDDDDTVASKIRKFEGDIDEKFSKFKDTIVNEVGVKIEDALKKVVDVNSNETFVANTEQNEDVNKLIDQMMNSRDLKAFEKIAELEFFKVEVSDVENTYYCDVCYSNNHPNFGVLDKNKPGCFLLNLSDMRQELLECEGLVPRSLRNVKSHIKRHILDSKVHMNKQKEKKDLIRKHIEHEARNRKVGLNIFRIRYSGLRQHKPRSSFENDLLMAKLNGTDIGDINHSRFFEKI